MFELEKPLIMKPKRSEPPDIHAMAPHELRAYHAYVVSMGNALDRDGRRLHDHFRIEKERVEAVLNGKASREEQI